MNDLTGIGGGPPKSRQGGRMSGLGFRPDATGPDNTAASDLGFRPMAQAPAAAPTPAQSANGFAGQGGWQQGDPIPGAPTPQGPTVQPPNLGGGIDPSADAEYQRQVASSAAEQKIRSQDEASLKEMQARGAVGRGGPAGTDAAQEAVHYAQLPSTTQPPRPAPRQGAVVDQSGMTPPVFPVTPPAPTIQPAVPTVQPPVAPAPQAPVMRAPGSAPVTGSVLTPTQIQQQMTQQRQAPAGKPVATSRRRASSLIGPIRRSLRR